VGDTSNDGDSIQPGSCLDGSLIPIHVDEDAHAPRLEDPVSGGIPFARGTLHDVDLPYLTLFDGTGAVTPSMQQPVPLGYWDDGSIKWLLLDFAATVPAGGRTTFALCQTPTTPPRSPALALTEDNASFTIDTGALRAKVSKNHFSLFDEVFVDANGNGSYEANEKTAGGPGEMFVDLDDSAPGAADAGAYNYPDTWYFGMEGGNWMRASQAASTARYLASLGDYSISVFRAGTMHTILKMEGWYRNASTNRQFPKYCVYLHFYAGKSSVRFSHTWIMTGNPANNFIRRMAIALPFAGASGTLSYAIGGAFETEGTPVSYVSGEPTYMPITRGPSELISGTLAAGDAVSIASIGPNKYYHNVPNSYDLRVEYTVRKNGATVTTGYAPSGWTDINNGTFGIAAGVQDFWREHPKEIRYQAGTMYVYLWPDEGGKTLDLRRRYPEARGDNATLGKAARREFSPTGSAVGLAKTTDVLFYFHGGTHSVARVDDVQRGFEDPLRPFVSGAYNTGTGVFGNLHPYDYTSFPKTENYLDLTYAWILRAAKEFGWYGMLDYGDYLLEFESINWELDVPANPQVFQNWGYSGWTHENYRVGPWMMLQYLRSGRHFWFKEADAWLRHKRDIDCVHWDTPDDGSRPGDNNGGARLGGGKRHDQQHWGGYMTGYGIPTIGTAHHYFLTGEGRDLDAMALYSDWILHASHIENQGIYSVLYMGEALQNSSLISEAWSNNITPNLGFGRWLYDSGMGLLMHDIQTHGRADVRARLKNWAAMSGTEYGFLRGYIESQEHQGTYTSQIHADFAEIFPANSVRTSYFSWAPRLPNNYRDACHNDFMPHGPWQWPFRSIEHLMFDGPFGLGNNPSRHQFAAHIVWMMDTVGDDP
jgi:hypothetical protein